MVTPTGETYTYHYNGIGSTVAMTNQSQTIINSYNYEPFGKLTIENETVPQSFKYVGQHGVMSETNGLLFMRARYFDADTGRFISEDPIGFGGKQTNLYAYVGNNPINAIDPFGLKASTGGNTFSNTVNTVSNTITNVINGVGDSLANVNVQTVAIGTATAALGVGAVVTSVASGTAATIASSGIGFSPAVYSAGQGVILGITATAVGVGDIVGGLQGQESILPSTFKSLYLTPPGVTAVNPF